MKETVYLVVCSDRHADLIFRAYKNKDDAIDFVKGWLEEEGVDNFEEFKHSSFVISFVHVCEDDYASVIETELN